MSHLVGKHNTPKWGLSVFSKYSTKFICFHKVHKRTENWKAFTWMATISNLFVSTKVIKQLKIEWLGLEWRPCAFSIYLTKFICFHTGHKRTKNWKAFTWMAARCLLKILDQIYLFPQGSQKNWKLKGFHLNGERLFKILDQMYQHRKVLYTSP